MRRILFALATAFLIALGGVPATVASASQSTSGECEIDDPTWQVSETSEDAVVLQECGGQGGSAETGTADGDDTLPVTGWEAGIATGAAVALVGTGTGLYWSARRRRLTFRA